MWAKHKEVTLRKRVKAEKKGGSTRWVNVREKDISIIPQAGHCMHGNVKSRREEREKAWAARNRNERGNTGGERERERETRTSSEQSRERYFLLFVFQLVQRQTPSCLQQPYTLKTSRSQRKRQCW